MKKVLIIAYSFPPTANVGNVRLFGIAKNIPEYGWHPIVVTPEIKDYIETTIPVYFTKFDDIVNIWKKRCGLNTKLSIDAEFNVKNKKNRKSWLMRLISPIEEIITYPDRYKGWSPYALEECRKIIENQKVDLVFSSSFPPTSHIIACQIACKYNIPWVADFRDLWTQNHYYKYSRIRHFFERNLELKSLYHANALTTVSQPLADNLEKIHAKKVYSIPNGFDIHQSNPGIQVSEKFSISYTGAIYKDRQNPEPLFKAIKGLIDNGLMDPAAIEINFFGHNLNWLMEDIKKYNLENVVRIFGFIHRDLAVKKQRESQVLLLLTWNDPTEKGVYTGKIFDYLAAQRPILALGLKGSVLTELLKRTKAGFEVTTDAEIKDVLLMCYNEYRNNGQVQYTGNLSEVNQFTHLEMARKFAEVFDFEIVNTNSAPD